MPADDLKAQREKLRKARDEAEKAALEKAHELEVLENRRAELKKRDPKTEANIEKVKAELQTNHRRAEFARERYDALETAQEKLTKRIKSLSRRIRNSIKPKIVDLHMSGPCTPMGPVYGSIGHYTAGPLARTDEEAVRMWWQVRAQHLGQGWSNIGYHIGLGPEGGIYLLRPRNCVGAHTLGKNTGYIGLSVHGTTGHTWTAPQKRALNYALKHFGLYDKPVTVHSDHNPTACPGSFEAGYKSKGN